MSENNKAVPVEGKWMKEMIKRAERRNLCEKACAGMSDEDVAYLPTHFEIYKANTSKLEKTADDVSKILKHARTLKRDLADALSLLDMAHIILYDAGRYNMAHQVKAFLAKHKKGVGLWT